MAATSPRRCFRVRSGWSSGLELTGNPFVLYPSYREIADLPLAERVAEMRKPEVRQRILTDKPAADGHPLMFACQAWDYMFPLGSPPNYEPSPSDSHLGPGRGTRCEPAGRGLRPGARR